MKRRQFIASLLGVSGTAVRAPLSAQDDVPGSKSGVRSSDEAPGTPAVQREQLLLALHDTRQELVESRERLSSAYSLVYQMYTQVGSMLMAARRVRRSARWQLPDEARDELKSLERDAKRFFWLVGQV